MPEHPRVVSEVEATRKLLSEIGSGRQMAADGLGRLEHAITRISTMFAVQALDSVDFHHLDEDLSKGRLDPRFVPIIKKSLGVADPMLYPPVLKGLVTSLQASLLKLEAALVNKDLEPCSSASHEAHELYHQLQHESEEWLQSSTEGSA